MAGNVIYRGPVTSGWQPRTVTDKTVAGAYLPGTFVEEAAATLVQLTTALAKLPMILSNMDFKDQDIDTAYASGDTGVAYHLEARPNLSGPPGRRDLRQGRAPDHRGRRSPDRRHCRHPGRGLLLRHPWRLLRRRPR